MLSIIRHENPLFSIIHFIIFLKIGINILIKLKNGVGVFLPEQDWFDSKDWLCEFIYMMGIFLQQSGLNMPF